LWWNFHFQYGDCHFPPGVTPIIREELCEFDDLFEENDLLFLSKNSNVEFHDFQFSSDSTNTFIARGGRVMPLLMNMLENLITIGLPERIDILQFQEFSVFIQQNYHIRIFELLFYHYFTKLEIDLSNVNPAPNQRKRERAEEEDQNKVSVLRFP
jgi:hypothetical protein